MFLTATGRRKGFIGSLASGKRREPRNALHFRKKNGEESGWSLYAQEYKWKIIIAQRQLVRTECRGPEAGRDKWIRTVLQIS